MCGKKCANERFKITMLGVNKKRIRVLCGVCRLNMIEVIPSRAKRNPTCSIECRNETIRMAGLRKRGKKILSLQHEKSNNWKGDSVSYSGLHKWVKRYLGRPDQCIECGNVQNLQWANKSHEYKRELEDWISMCVKCHKAYDKDSRAYSKYYSKEGGYIFGL